MFQYSINPTPDFLILQLARGDVRHTLAFEAELTGHERIGSTLTQLQAGVAGVAEHLANRAPLLSRTGLTQEAEGLVDRTIKSPFELSVEAAHKERRSLEAEWSRLHTPKFADGADPAVRVEQRNYARSRKLPEAIAAAQRDPGLAAAIIEGGPAMSGLPADVFAVLRHDMAVGQLATILASQHDYLTPPTADDPVAGLPDFEAARAVAAKRFATLEAERELIGRIPALLSNVVSAVALMLETSRQAAYERLTA